MSIYEYNEEAARKSLTEMGYEQGLEDGEKKGRKEGRQEGREEGRQEGRQEGKSEILVKNVDSIMKNLNLDLQRACEAIGITQDEYTRAKSKL